MPKLVAERLRNHRTRQLEERLAAGEHWQDHGLVYCSRQGMSIHSDPSDS
jgi:hypothetical protein